MNHDGASPPETQGLELREQYEPRRFVLAARGEVDISTAGILDAAVGRALLTGVPAICLDLSEVSFADSTALAVMLKTDAALRADGRRLTLICPDGPVRRVLTLCGIDRMVDVFADHASADGADGDGAGAGAG